MSPQDQNIGKERARMRFQAANGQRRFHGLKERRIRHLMKRALRPKLSTRMAIATPRYRILDLLSALRPSFLNDLLHQSMTMSSWPYRPVVIQKTRIGLTFIPW